MIAIYAPDGCACDLIDAGLAMPGLNVQRFELEAAACRAFLMHMDRYAKSFEVTMVPLARYWCIHGPGGHVIGVR